MSTLMLYFIFIADNLRHFLGKAGAISMITVFITFFIALIYSAFNSDNDRFNFTDNEFLKHCRKLIFIILIISMLTFGLESIIPSTKSMAAIYVIPLLIEHTDIETIPQNACNIVNEGFKELIKLIASERNIIEEVVDTVKAEIEE